MSLAVVEVMLFSEAGGGGGDAISCGVRRSRTRRKRRTVADLRLSLQDALRLSTAFLGEVRGDPGRRSLVPLLEIEVGKLQRLLDAL